MADTLLNAPELAGHFHFVPSFIRRVDSDNLSQARAKFLRFCSRNCGPK